MEPAGRYDVLAALFEYPERDYPARVRAAIRRLGAEYPSATARLEAFAAAVPESVTEMQEIFTRSFDVQPVTTLSVGYLLFGDDYKRGELLVNLNREHRDAGVDCGRELSDHLPNVLRLLQRWHDREEAGELAREIVRPAVARMLAEFRPDRMEERNRLYERHFRTLIASSAGRGTMFRAPLEALLEVLDRDFQCREQEPPRHDSTFLRSIGRELEIEGAGEKP